MTQLKTVIWPDAPPAKPGSAELTFAAKRRAAEIIAGLEREGVVVALKDDRLRVTATGVHAALRCLRSSAAPISSKSTFERVHDEAARRIQCRVSQKGASTSGGRSHWGKSVCGRIGRQDPDRRSSASAAKRSRSGRWLAALRRKELRCCGAPLSIKMASRALPRRHR